MRNYWRRFKYYRLDSRYPNPGRLGQHSCYERSMALSYYMLCRRLCDMPFIDTSAIVKGSKRIFKELNVHPEKVITLLPLQLSSDAPTIHYRCSMWLALKFESHRILASQ